MSFTSEMICTKLKVWSNYWERMHNFITLASNPRFLSPGLASRLYNKAIEGKTWVGKPVGYYRLAAFVVLKCSRSQLTESFLKLQLLQIF